MPVGSVLANGMTCPLCKNGKHGACVGGTSAKLIFEANPYLESLIASNSFLPDVALVLLHISF